MAHVWLDKDEWYPVYTLTNAEDEDHFGELIELPDDLVQRYDEARRAFDAVQDELETAWKAHLKAQRVSPAPTE